jgi:hypothetical protein
MTSPQAQPPAPSHDLANNGLPPAQPEPAAEELSDVQLLQMAAMATGYSSIEPGKCVMVSGSELIAYGYAVAAAARAALAAQPEPSSATGPSVAEVDAAWNAALCPETCRYDMMAFVREILARWGRPAAEPAPASEIEALMLTHSSVEPVMGASRVLCEAAFGTVAREIADHWGPPPTAVPVPVSEGRPTAADCDEQGRCWWGENSGYDDATWEFYAAQPDTALWSHWLPAGALPVPPPEDNTTPEP